MPEGRTMMIILLYYASFGILLSPITLKGSNKAFFSSVFGSNSQRKK
jgi:hypothetical protein